MDVIRSAYSVPMRFFHNSPNERVVNWYFVPDDRETIPFDHAFYSRIYERDEDDQDALGERFAPVPWRGGLPPAPEIDHGFCGRKDQWQFGCDVAEPLPANLGACCSGTGPPVDLVGNAGPGIEFSGFGVVMPSPPPGPVAVPFCGGLLSQNLQLDLRPASLCPCLPGHIEFDWDGIDAWRSITAGGTCAGIDVSTWFLESNGVDSLVLFTGPEDITGTVISCAPPTLLFIHTDILFPYCGVIAGNWQGDLTER